ADRNIEGAYVPFGSEQAVIIEVHEARNKISFLNVETGEETKLPEISGNLIPIAPVGAGAWGGRYYSSRQIADIVRFSLLDFQPSTFVSLTRVKEKTKISANDLAPAENFRWKSVDGLGIQGWLYRAKDKANGTIVCVHGGPTSHDEDVLDDEVQ